VLERLRLRIADDLHDDIGSELSGIALESDMLARQLPEGVPEQRRLRDVGRTVRHAADSLREAVWLINPEQDKLGDLVTRMREVASVLLAGVEYAFDTEGQLSASTLEMEFRRHVLMIFKEMLHNVVKHAKAGTVRIRVEIGPKELTVCVQDDGVGFDPGAEHSGRGMRTMRSRASAIGGEIAIESLPGSGTRICLTTRIARL
jgi:signal transduction histidine kinase